MIETTVSFTLFFFGFSFCSCCFVFEYATIIIINEIIVKDNGLRRMRMRFARGQIETFIKTNFAGHAAAPALIKRINLLFSHSAPQSRSDGEPETIFNRRRRWWGERRPPCVNLIAIGSHVQTVRRWGDATKANNTEPNTERKLISEIFGCNVFAPVDKQSGNEHVPLRHGQSIITSSFRRRWALSAANFIVAFALSPSMVGVARPLYGQGIVCTKFQLIFTYSLRKLFTIFEMLPITNSPNREAAASQHCLRSSNVHRKCHMFFSHWTSCLLYHFRH